MAHLLTVSNETGGVTCTTASFTVPATATYCTVMAYMRGSDGGETTLVSAEVGGQSVTLDNSLYRQFDVFQAVEGGYILSADMPSGSVTASATRTSAQGGFGITVCFFDDAAQQAPVASKDGDGSGGDPFNTNLTMPTAGVIVDGIVTSNTGVTFTTNQTDQTQRATESGGSVNLFTSTRVVGSGSQTMGWDTQANGDRTSHLLFGLEESGVATPTIDTNDDPIRLGTTSSHTVSDFGGPITSAIISRDGISVAATSVSDTQATWPALAQNLVIPACGTGATLTLSDGTDTADVTIEFLPEAGFTWRNVLTVSGSLIEGDWGFGLGLESNQDGYITRDSDSAIATHNDDGSTTWLDYGTSLVYSWDKNAIVGDDGGLTSITLNNLENGPLLTLPTGTATGQTTASGTVTTDEGNGTLYYLASVNASESSGTIKAGSSQAVTATGVQNVTVTGLTASTNYYLHYVQTNTLLEDSNVASSAQFTTDSIQAPILASTKALSGVIDQSFTKTLTIQGGDPATSWLITGGADQAEYSLSNSGVLTRDVPNPLEESEVITVTASNAGGTSNTQTVTITYGVESNTRRKRKKTMLRNFYYFREEWEKMSERNKDRN